MTDRAPHPIDLTRFVRSEYSHVVAAVAFITGERQGAADAVHDVLVQLMTRPPSPAPTNVAAWVTVAASNRARDARRRRLTESRAISRLGTTAAIPVDPHHRLDVVAAVRALPPRQRQVTVLHYLADESVQAIAQATGLSEGTIKTHLSRARRALAARLAPRHSGRVPARALSLEHG